MHVYAELILTSIGLLSTCLCILLAVFLLIANGPLKPANRFLSGFLFLTAIDMIGWAGGLLPATWRELLPYRLPLAYLQMPLLYVYAVSLCSPRRRPVRHLIGGLVVALVSAVTFKPHVWAWAFPESAASDLLGGLRFAWVVNDIALHLQFYVYIVLMGIVLAQYRLACRQSLTNPATLTFKWVATVVGVSFCAHTLVLVKSFAWLGHRSAAPTLEIVVAVVAVIVTCAMTLSALLRQDMFLGAVVEPVPAIRDPFTPKAPGSTKAEAIAIARVRSYMEEKEPYLDPSLTIRSLARRLGMGQRELSKLINQQMGVHFFDYVNRYRVEKAKAMLNDPAKHEMSMLEIAFEAGFNTKSSYNAAFRKHLGSTPTGYQKSSLAQKMP